MYLIDQSILILIGSMSSITPTIMDNREEGLKNDLIGDPIADQIVNPGGDRSWNIDRYDQRFHVFSLDRLH